MKLLEKELQKHFISLPKQYKYEVYNLAEKSEKFPSLTPDIHFSTLHLIHRLILVTGFQMKDKDDTVETEDKQLLSGLEVYEYTTKKQPYTKTVYISKIDTTGSSLSRGVTRRLVQAYISTQTKDSLITTCHIHVFARSQPQYLFTNSARNKNKSILNDRQLVGWWRSILSEEQKEQENELSGYKIKKYWIIPGIDDEHTALLDIKQQKEQLNTTIGLNSNKWIYGHPYDTKALAKKVIPRFEDDGKCRYLGSLTNDDDSENITVEEFWTMFGYSEECGSGKLTGIFVIRIEKNQEDMEEKQQPTDNEEEEDQQLFSNDQYTNIWNQFLGLEFNNDEENKKSTHQFLKQFENEFKSITTYITTNNGSSKNENSQLKPTHQTINLLNPKRKEPQYNVLVPKRRKTDS
ncbi:histone acetylation protein-domain-containing protein [Cunninghamella echinulata]|nr:histone acetylation protein-domain-containing protein [Cunninghamella echinulata]